MPVTAEEVRARNNSDVIARMDSAGLTLDHLIKCLKRELKAQVTKTQKVKGVPHEVAKGVRTICVTGLIEKHTTRDGIEKDYTEGDSVIAINEIAWEVRQKARMDAHRLRGDYPAEEHKHEGAIDITLRDCVKEASDGSGD